MTEGGAIAADDLLVLHYDRFAERAEAFFTRMATSAAFREVFLRDPAGTLSETILAGYGAPSTAEVNQANRLLFALLGNEGFMEWARSYEGHLNPPAAEAADVDDMEQVRLAAATHDRSQMFADLIRAITENPDFETMCSIMVRGESAAVAGITRPPQAVATYEETLVAGYVAAVFFVLVVAVVVAGAPQGPTQTLTRVDLETVTHFLTEQLPARAAEIRASGSLTDIGRIRGG